jgi:hypothetical protein
MGFQYMYRMRKDQIRVVGILITSDIENEKINLKIILNV